MTTERGATKKYDPTKTREETEYELNINKPRYYPPQKDIQGGNAHWDTKSIEFGRNRRTKLRFNNIPTTVNGKRKQGDEY